MNGSFFASNHQEVLLMVSTLTSVTISDISTVICC